MLAASSLTGLAGVSAAPASPAPIKVSGIYPHLAVTNNEHSECGIGAVAVWAGHLWYITYPAHATQGSTDKLYEVAPDMARITRPESIGGTHADRMVHRESNQLIIGPYFISADGHVRHVDVHDLVGRITAVSRDLTDPANEVYMLDMEGRLYEVNVHTLAVKLLFEKPVPGWHAKGAYTGQGRLVITNNGEDPGRQLANPPYQAVPVTTSPEDAGVLAEWDGKHWKIDERRQFTEVTGPGGIYGAAHDGDPLWTMGWDKRSIILKSLDQGVWHDFRLPKGTYTYSPRHGWYTEWPRIRAVGDGHFLADMHGTLFSFPASFNSKDTAGLLPIATHLKMFADFCDWQKQIVFACDDASLFGNPLLGQPQSNLWFTTYDKLKELSPPLGFGGPWLHDDVKANEESAPYLFGGYTHRTLHLYHKSPYAVTFVIQVGPDDHGTWRTYESVAVPPEEYRYVVFPDALKGEWIRLRTVEAAADVIAWLTYNPVWREPTADDKAMFQALPGVDAPVAPVGGIVRPMAGNAMDLDMLAGAGETRQMFQVDAGMNVRPIVAPDKAAWMEQNASLSQPGFAMDAASIILTENGKRYRIPRSNPAYDHPFGDLWPRALREVVTERNLLNCDGAFYEAPRPDAGGYSRMRPICTHDRKILDFCSWRGMLVLSGTRPGAQPDGHYFGTADGSAGAWFGNVDDLWRLGKPRGYGGPWMDTPVHAGEPSDPYLMNGFDNKELKLSDDSKDPVVFTVEVDVTGQGDWLTYERFRVEPGQALTHQFQEGYGAFWLRVLVNHDCRATAQLKYS